MTPTPGPWRIETWHYSNPDREVLTVQTNRDAIAQVCDLWPPDERQAEKEANARLIASAPALLAQTEQQQMLINDAARILRALLGNDPNTWDDARDWLNSYDDTQRKDR